MMSIADYIAIVAIVVGILCALIPYCKQKSREFEEDLLKLSDARAQFVSCSTSKDYGMDYLNNLELVTQRYLEALEVLCKNYSARRVIAAARSDLSFVQSQQLIDARIVEEPWISIKRVIIRMK